MAYVESDSQEEGAMNQTEHQNRVKLPESLTNEMGKVAATLPDWQLDAGLLSPRTWAEYRSALRGLTGMSEVIATCDALLNQVGGDGFAVLELGPLLDACGSPENGLRAVTALLSLLASPLRAFDRWPLWKPLGTNTDIDPMRATGTGYNPLHIDVVNSTLPPDYSALLCIRPDPRGRGESLVSQLRRAVSRLGPADLRLLSEEAYRDGSFHDLTGVGREWNPFPVLDGLSKSKGFVRFTAKMLAGADPDDPHTKAARALEQELIAQQRRFLLNRGDLVIVNQHLCCHGREPLGDGQEQLHPDERRLLLQIFLRNPEATV
ncbi:TauD/TfdA family dioxygenase [Streptomyces sp. URMC 129]|uniref:TauD/TfdA family dioxygenase n=1 Tax=Streptomyces sp. URMC 129 TaxID=3423407 RepID=UPI003F1ACBBA